MKKMIATMILLTLTLTMTGCALSVKPSDGDRTRDCYRQASYGDSGAYGYTNCKR